MLGGDPNRGAITTFHPTGSRLQYFSVWRSGYVMQGYADRKMNDKKIQRVSGIDLGIGRLWSLVEKRYDVALYDSFSEIDFQR